MITGLLLAEQLPRRGHYHLATSSARRISAHRQHGCVLAGAGSRREIAALMQRNLFIIISVNVIGVRADKQICDSCYSRVCFDAARLHGDPLKVPSKESVAVIFRKFN